MDAALMKALGGLAIRRVTANPGMPLATERTGGTGLDQDLSGYSMFEFSSICMSGAEQAFWRDVAEGRGGPAAKQICGGAALAKANLTALDGYNLTELTSKRKAAQEALAIHPQCPEAYALLGLCSDTIEEALEYYRKGEALGSETMADFKARLRSGNAWTHIPARGYFRCAHGVANCLRKMHARGAGKAAAEESLAMYQQLQRMQAVRLSDADYVNFAYHLPEAYLRCNDLIGFDRLFADAKVGTEMCLYTSSMLGWVFSRVLRDYKTDPEQPRWQWLDPSFREVFRLGGRAVQQDDFAYRICSLGGAVFYAISNFRAVVELLTGQRPLPDSTLPLTYGSSETLEQAVAYVASAGDLWDEGARTWLRQNDNMIHLLDMELPRSRPGNAHAKASLRLIKDGIPTAAIGPVAHRVPGPLHKAAYYDGPSEIISALLEAGINPTATGGPCTGPNEGHNPIQMAACQGNPGPLRQLLAWCQSRLPDAQFHKLLRGAVEEMMSSSVYYCIKGGPSCQRCSHVPHSRNVSFEKCVAVLLEMGLTDADLPPKSSRHRHPLLELLKEGVGAPAKATAALPSPSSAPKQSEKACGLCKRADVKLKACAGCLEVHYCSPKCQKKHWKAHKKECASLRK